MAKTFSDAFSEALEIIKDDLVDAFIVGAAKAMGQRPSPKFKYQRTGRILQVRGRVVGDGIEISFPSYAAYLEFGTGVYGPKKSRIYPKTKKALAWGKNLGGGKKEFVFKSVAGMMPSPFIRPVLHTQFVDIVVNAFNEAFKNVKVRA